MRQRGYSHPQLSSGCACRDKRWSGLIPSNEIESYHLLSSVAFGSAQWECPHLKDTCTATTLEGNQILLHQTGSVSALLKRIVWGGSLGGHRTKSAKGEMPSPPYKPTHTPDWGPACRHSLETQAWTWVGMQPRAGEKGESATKAEFMLVTSFFKRSPKPTDTYFTTALHPCHVNSWSCRSHFNSCSESPDTPKISLFSFHPAMHRNINFVLLWYILQEPPLLKWKGGEIICRKSN